MTGDQLVGAQMAGDRTPLLSVRDLVVEFDSPSGPLRALDGVSFDIYPDETVAIVGESGSGKTISMLAVMGLMPPGAHIAGGSITFRGVDMVTISGAQRRNLLGKEISMIFQDPMSSMNPVIKIGKQIGEMVHLHAGGLTRRQIKDRVVELLELVRIPNAVDRYSSYPHEFSGGMRQRAMIAMAVAHNPGLLIADEPTTALDVTIQAQVLRVLRRIRKEVGASMALITHDLGLVAESADRVVVMYGGRVIETGTVERIFRDPHHPYTVGLLASSLRLDTPVDVAYAIPGQPPTIDARPSGCVFRPRCGLSAGRAVCETDVPVLRRFDDEVACAACHFAEETKAWATASGAAAAPPVSQGSAV